MEPDVEGLGPFENCCERPRDRPGESPCASPGETLDQAGDLGLGAGFDLTLADKVAALSLESCLVTLIKSLLSLFFCCSIMRSINHDLEIIFSLFKGLGLSDVTPH